MAKDIKLYKDGNEISINETQLDSFISLGWKQEKENITKLENEFNENTVTIKNLKGVKGENNQTIPKENLVNEIKKLI